MDPIHWLDNWVDCINRGEYSSGRALFDENVLSFGTFADHVHGLDELVANQWEEIWPYIKAFKFDPASIKVVKSAGEDLATISALWSSLGLAPDGSTFTRAGRATIVLQANDDGVLRAIHTHLSLSKGQIARSDAIEGAVRSDQDQ